MIIIYYRMCDLDISIDPFRSFSRPIHVPEVQWHRHSSSSEG